MSNRLVSIVIVTKGAQKYLAACIASLARQDYRGIEIIVIDNSLRPVFAKEIIRDYPELNLYSSPKDLSYCESMNKGISMGKGDFLLSLNDDVVLDQHFIKEALKGFDLNPEVGAVSGKILRFDGKTIDSTELALNIWLTAGERGYNREDRGQFNKQRVIFGVNGAVAFYRRRMLEEIKTGWEYFDSDFGFFYEDLDIAWRAHNFGWKSYYVPTAIAYHARGSTARGQRSDNGSFARRYLNDSLHFDLLKNRWLVIIKNAGISVFLLHLPFIVFYDLLAWSYVILARPMVLKQVHRLPVLLKSAFKKRQAIMRLISQKKVV
jgi:GT2 family glycosyltransferase